MSYLFKKLIEGAFVKISGMLGYKVLTTETPSEEPEENLKLEDGKVNLIKLELPEGSYKITVVAIATGLKPSEHSNEVVYIVE